MKTTLALSLSLLVFFPFVFAGEPDSVSVDLPVSTIAHKLVDAEYVIVPSKTEMQRIPGCIPSAEAGEDCMREVIIESYEAIQANVSYQRSANPDSEGQEVSWVSFKFDLSQFGKNDVDSLKAVYPRWKHPFSRAFKRFASSNLDLSVKTASRTIKVIDMSRSKLCRVQQDGTRQPGCVDYIVWKEVYTKVKQVTVSVK